MNKRCAIMRTMSSASVLSLLSRLAVWVLCLCASRLVTLLSGGSARPRESARVCRRVRGSRDLRGTVYSHYVLTSYFHWAPMSQPTELVGPLAGQDTQFLCSNSFEILIWRSIWRLLFYWWRRFWFFCL